MENNTIIVCCLVKLKSVLNDLKYNIFANCINRPYIIYSGKQ